MAKNNPYYKITQNSNNETLEAAITLVSEEYGELPSAGDENVAAQLFIDTDAKLFWFISPDALRTTERIIQMKQGLTVQNASLEDIKEGFLALSH